MDRYAIYTRQSTADAGTVLSSCDVQFSICEDFVRSRATPEWAWIGERLDDVGHSGADMERPALQRLMQLVHDGAVDTVVIYRLGRLPRSPRASMGYLRADDMQIF